jgi:hypothetical protein
MVTVLFIAGGGRSGSTILHNLLGQIDGFVAVGELRYIWGRAALKNQSCGCGVPFSQCVFWHDVMIKAFGGLDRSMAREMLDLTESFRIRESSGDCGPTSSDSAGCTPPSNRSPGAT